MGKIELEDVGKLEEEITQERTHRLSQQEILRRIISYEKKHSQSESENEEKGRECSNYARLLKSTIDSLQDACNNFE
jgi:hypothetical protein